MRERSTVISRARLSFEPRAITIEPSVLIVIDVCLIRVTGGYDTITGLPFKGTLSLRSNALERDARRLVTPQTSMLSGAAQTNLDLLTKAGIVGSGRSLHDDHVGSLLSAEAIRAQLSAFLVRMSVVAAELSAPKDSLEDLQADAWHMGYSAMAKQLASAHAAGSAGAFGEVFSSPAALRQLVREVVHAHLHPGQPMPAGFALPNESAMSGLLQFSADLVALGEELVAAMQAGSVTPEQMNASLRVLALASERGLEDALDPELGDLFAWVREQISPDGGLRGDLAGLGAENIDLGVLIDRDFDFDPASNSISARAVVPAQAATAFAAVANTAFRGSVDKEEQGDAMIFLMGDYGARSGKVKLCVRYRDDDGDFDTVTASDPDGALLVGGRWNLLNGHTLTLNVDIVGGTRPLIVKSVGISGSNLDYRFDFGGDLSEWTGAAPAGFAAGSVPANDAACRAALIDEFGVMS